MVIVGSQGLGISSNAGKPVSLKAQLRELYKLIHPDLFQDHPPAREENERSFKLLQVFWEERAPVDSDKNYSSLHSQFNP